jgi:phospholipase/carboxylesterase
MNDVVLDIEGLRTIVVGAATAGSTLVVILHGYSMTAADLAPFAHSLRVDALFLFPEGPLAATDTGRCWFPLDVEARRRAGGAPRDLADRQPEGLIAARARLGAFLLACRERYRPSRVVLGGFSQGGMLICDAVLQSAATADALLLMSSSRINVEEWRMHRERLRGLPVLIAHGQSDPELAFSAGTAFRDFLMECGARVTWLSFEGGHEIPLVVWRAVRKFLHFT